MIRPWHIWWRESHCLSVVAWGIWIGEKAEGWIGEGHALGIKALMSSVGLPVIVVEAHGGPSLEGDLMLTLDSLAADWRRWNVGDKVGPKEVSLGGHYQ